MGGLIARRLRGAAINRGVLGESRFWLVVAVAMGVRFAVRKLAGDGPKVLYSGELGPTDRLIITAAGREGE